MRGPEWHSKTGKNSAFQAQCNHSHICCLLGQYSGCYRCGKFLTLLLKFIASFGFTVSWAKKRSWNAPRESPVPLNDCVAPLHRGESAKHMLPCVGEKTQQTKHKQPAVQVTQEQTQSTNMFIMTQCDGGIVDWLTHGMVMDVHDGRLWQKYTLFSASENQIYTQHCHLHHSYSTLQKDTNNHQLKKQISWQ